MRTLGNAADPRDGAGWEAWDMPRRKPGYGRGRAVALFLVLCAAVFLAGAALDAAWAASPKKGDVSGATDSLEIIQDDTANKWDYDGSGITTRLRWLGQKGGNLVYCINPGVTHGPFEGESRKLPARLLRVSDFKDAALYEACLAALYYAPGGPGYENEDDSTKGLIGAKLFPDEDWNGNSFGRKDRFATAHCLMGFYYNDANWDKTYPQASRQPSERYKAFFQKWLIPAAFGGTGSASYGQKALEHFNDDDMLDNGGYTVQAWKDSVYLVMSGEDDRQDLLTFVDAPRGPLNLVKRSGDPSMTDGNSCYSLAGARYGVYSDKALKREVGTIVTDSSGAGSLEALVAGTYYVKELETGAGYLPDPAVHAVVVRKDAGGSFTSQEPPRHAPLQLVAGKVDALNRTNVPQGSASLAGAEFTLSHYAGYHAAVSALPGSALRTWTVKTDSTGRALKELDLPLGTYAVREAKAPAGYLPDTKVRLIHVVADDAAEHGAVVKPINYDNKGSDVPYANATASPIVAEQAKTCGFTMAKVDADLDSGKAQGDAALEGAVFSVANDSPNPVTVNGKSYRKGEECLTVTAKAAGGSIVAGCDGSTLPFGDYVIREKAAPPGYLPNRDWSARISCTEAMEDGHVWDLSTNPCPDPVIRGGISVPKIDRELKEGVALGAASLEGAEISITLDSPQPVQVDGVLHSPGEVVKTLVTGADGVAATGLRDLPYGTYTLREVKPPAGYLANDAWSFKAEVRGDGVAVEADPVDDQVKRGDVRLNKASAGDMARMGQVAFLVTSKTTGERHIAVTDENGSLDTSAAWNKHTAKTNANDAALVPSGSDGAPGTGGAEGDAGESDGGSEETLEEAGEEDPVGDDAHDSEGDADEAAGDDGDSAESTREGSDDALEAQSAEQTVEQQLTEELADALGAESVDIEDLAALRAAIEGAKPGQSSEIAFSAKAKADGKATTYALIAALQEDGSIAVRDADTDEELAFIEAPDAGTPDAGEEDGGAPSAHDAEPGDGGSPEEGPPSQASDGEEDATGGSAKLEVDDAALDAEAGLWFSGAADRQTAPDDALGALPYDTYTFQELRGNANAGYTPVCFDVRISRDATTLDMGTVDDEHAPAPTLETELLAAGEMHVALASGTVELVDSVHYSGAEPGVRYTMRGCLVDKATGKQAGPDSSVAFTAQEASGSVDVPLSVEADTLAGGQVVAYQEMLHEGTVVAEHKDPDDAAETVGFPAITTELSTTGGSKAVPSGQKADLVDRVDFAGLMPGMEYTLEAALHARAGDGSDAGVLKDASGNEVTARLAFTPTTASGSVAVPFSLEVPAGSGAAVAFERLYAGGELLAAHEDIDDESQAVAITEPPEEPGPEPEPEEPPEPEPSPDPEPSPEPEPTPQPQPDPEPKPEPTPGKGQPEKTPATTPGKETPAQTGDSQDAFAALVLATLSGCIAQAAAIRRSRARDYREW